MHKIFFSLVLAFSVASVANAKKTPGAERKPNTAENNGLSQVNIQDKNNWIRLEGSSAKALYNALSVPAKNNQGEAGADLYFKTGKSYQCWMDKADATDGGYVCTLMIKDAGLGIIR